METWLKTRVPVGAQDVRQREWQQLQGHISKLPHTSPSGSTQQCCTSVTPQAAHTACLAYLHQALCQRDIVSTIHLEQSMPYNPS
jgi:hypothetical protein